MMCLLDKFGIVTLKLWKEVVEGLVKVNASLQKVVKLESLWRVCLVPSAVDEPQMSRAGQILANETTRMLSHEVETTLLEMRIRVVELVIAAKDLLKVKLSESVWRKDLVAVRCQN
jgi:hypothetical protein